MKETGLLFMTLLLLCSFSAAQVDNPSDAGKSQNGGSYDSINTSNNYLQVEMPIYVKNVSPRTPFRYAIDLFPNVAPGIVGQASPTLGLGIQPYGGISYTATNTNNLCLISGNQFGLVPTFSNFAFTDGAGGYHALTKVSGTTTLACSGDNWVLISSDGSDMKLSASVDSNFHMIYSVYGPDGTVYVSNSRAGGLLSGGWVASTNIGVGNIVIDQNGNVQIVDTCTNWVCTSGTSTPTWNATKGGTTTDGKLTWLNLGLPTAITTDTDSNTTSLAITNLITQTSTTVGRDLTKPSVWTYTDPTNTVPLVVTYPAYTGSNGLPVPAPQITMQYTDSNSTTQKAVADLSPMSPTTDLWAGLCTSVPHGPSLLGVNVSLVDKSPSGNSFLTPALGYQYPIDIQTADGQQMVFTYENPPEAQAGSTTVTNVAITSNVATVQISAPANLVSLSPLTMLTVNGLLGGVTTGTVTYTGSKTWAVNDPVNLYLSGLPFGSGKIPVSITNVSGGVLSFSTQSGILCEIVATSSGNCMYNGTTSGFMAGARGRITFSGVAHATFLNSQYVTNWDFSVLDPSGKTIGFPITSANYTSAADSGTVTSVKSITGRVSSITLPTGGQIKYAYSGGSYGLGVNCSDGSNAIITKTTPDGTAIYNHTPSPTASTPALTTMVPGQTVFEVGPYGVSGVLEAPGNYGSAIPFPFQIANVTNVRITGSSSPYTATITYSNPNGGWLRVVGTWVYFNIPSTLGGKISLAGGIDSTGNPFEGGPFKTTSIGTNTFSFSCPTPYCTGALAQTAATGQIFSSSYGQGNDPNSGSSVYSLAGGDTAAYTTITDAKGNQTLEKFVGLRPTDVISMSGVPLNSAANPSFSTGDATSWTFAAATIPAVYVQGPAFTNFSSTTCPNYNYTAWGLNGSGANESITNSLPQANYGTYTMCASLSGFAHTPPATSPTSWTGAKVSFNVSMSIAANITLYANMFGTSESCTLTTSGTCTFGSATDSWGGSNTPPSGLTIQAYQPANGVTVSFTLSNITVTIYQQLSPTLSVVAAGGSTATFAGAPGPAQTPTGWPSVPVGQLSQQDLGPTQSPSWQYSYPYVLQNVLAGNALWSYIGNPGEYATGFCLGCVNPQTSDIGQMYNFTNTIDNPASVVAGVELNKLFWEGCAPGSSAILTMQLTLNNAAIGTAKTMPCTYAQNWQSITEGSPTDLWGTTGQLTPSNVGQVGIQFQLTNESSGSQIYIYVTNLQFYGDVGILSPNPTTVNFGNVIEHISSSLPDTITNTSGTNVNITSATVSGTGYTITGITPPVVLTPNQTITPTITLTPQSAGTITGTVTITSDAQNSPLTIPLTGVGVAQGILSAPSSVAFGSVLVGTGPSINAYVMNTGTSTVSVSAVSLTGTGFSFLTGLPATPFNVAPGQIVDFSVQVAPTTTSAMSGSVAITSNAANPILTMSLSATPVRSNIQPQGATTGYYAMISGAVGPTFMYAYDSASSDNYFPVNGGDSILYGGSIYRFNGRSEIAITCQFFDSSHTYISSCPNLGPAPLQPLYGFGPTGTPLGQNGYAPTTWTSYQKIVSSPASAVYVKFVLQVHGPDDYTNADPDTTPSTVLFDNLQITDLTSTNVLLEREITCYNSPLFLTGDPSVCTGPVIPLSVNTLPSQMDTYLLTPQTPGAAVTSKTFDSYGRLTDEKIYDYAATTFSREKTATYGTYTGPITTSANPANCAALTNTAIVNTLCESETKDSTGKIWAQFVAQYTSAGDMSLLNVIDGADAKIRVYNYTYTKGNYSQTTYPDGTTVSVNYNQCNNTLPSSITQGINTVLLTPDCHSGLYKSSTDINGNVWTTIYDSMGRPVTLKTPLTSTSFTDAITMSYAPTTVESKMSFNSGNSVVDNLITLDSSGRPSIKQTASSASTYNSVQNKYNVLGQLLSVSAGYYGAAGAAAPTGTETDSYVFDAIGRVTSFTDFAGATATISYTGRDSLLTAGGNSVQYETNSAGQTLSVCEITPTSVSGSGPCGQDVAQNGFLTTYFYDMFNNIVSTTRNSNTTNPQTTSFVYDGLGHRTKVTTALGTVTDVWNTDSSGVCPGSYVDDVIKEIDNAGNVACYTYDSFHRVLSQTYPSGPNAATTVSSYFVYDTVTNSAFTCPTGSTATKGELVEAYTGSSTSKITDEGFCYSPRGELTDVFEITPHSHQTYHTQLSYWESGDVKQLSGVPGTPAITYNEGYGSLSSVTAASGQQPLTSVSMQPDGRVQSVTFGSGDSDTFTYDSANRFTGFQSKIGSNTVSSAIGWNSPGTIASMNIADPINTSNTQNCSFAWDWARRPTQVKCINGSTNIWGQNFTYDLNGNLKKSNIVGFTGTTWQPTYNLGNNQYTGSTFAYDANGTLTNDTINTYKWNSDGAMHSVSNISTGKTTTYTYDALGRLVEEYNGALYYQYVFSPMGKIATTSSPN